MVTHGWEPKVIFVRSYWRWQCGRLTRVMSHLRVLDLHMSLRQSELQLALGLDEPGATR